MFDVGLQEILLVILVAIVVFGPDRLPEFARQAARFLHTVRGMARNAQSQLREELGPEYGDLNLRDLDPRVAIRQQVLAAMAEIEEEERQKESAEQAAVAAALPPPFDDEAT